jgi:hypothetical protein
MVSINQEIGAIIIAILVALLTFVIYKFLINRKKNSINYPKDTVILHQLPRGIRAPSISSFSLKLETWLVSVTRKHFSSLIITYYKKIRLRMAGIKYQV